MGEVKRISVALKVDTGDETYWSLIEPLQTNRQLSTFIITCLKAYVEDGDIHDAIDAYSRKGSGVDKIREHIENLMKLQAKANRTAEDINSSLGGDTEELEIENVFDDEDEDENEENNVTEKTHITYNENNSNIKGNVVAALPSSGEALNKIIKRLDKLEDTVGNLYNKVGSNSEHISKIENGVANKEKQEVRIKVDKKVKPVKEEVVNKKQKENTDKQEVKKEKEEIKFIKLDDISDKEAEKTENVDFSDLLGDFMSSVSN